MNVRNAKDPKKIAIASKKRMGGQTVQPEIHTAPSPMRPIPQDFPEQPRATWTPLYSHSILHLPYITSVSFPNDAQAPIVQYCRKEQWVQMRAV